MSDPRVPSLSARLARAWTRVLVRRSAIVLLLAGITGLLGFAALGRMGISADLINAFPAGDPEVARFRETIRLFGLAEEILVLVESEDGKPLDSHFPFIDAVVERISRSPRVADVEANLLRRAGSLFNWQRLPLYLSPQGVDELARRLSPEGMRRQMEENRALLESPAGAALEDVILRDPLNLRVIFAIHRTVLQEDSAGAASGGYIMNRDRKTLLLLVRLKPSPPPAAAGPIRRALGENPTRIIEEARRDVLAGWSGPVPLRFRATGLPVIQHEIQENARSGLVLSALSSFVLVFILFRLLFRDGSWLLVIFAATLGVGVGWTYAAIGLVYGRLNLFTFFVAAVIIGLGIDYLVHLTHRFWRERAVRTSPAEALRATLSTTGRSILSGAMTTIVAFLSILVTSFTGLHELGIVAALGIAACVAASFTVGATLLLRRAERGTPRRLPHLPGAERIAEQAVRRPRFVLVLWALLLAAAVAFIPSVRFDTSPEAMGLANSPALAAERDLAQAFGHRKNPITAVVEAPDVLTLLLRLGRVEDAARTLRSEGVLLAYRSASSFFPMPSDQRAALTRLGELRQSGVLPPPATLRGSLSRAAEKAGITWQQAFDAYVETLAAMVSVDRLMTLSDLPPSGTVGHFRSADGLQSTLYLYPPDGTWTPERLDRVRETLKAASAGTAVTGVPVLLSGLKGRVVREVALASVVATLAVTMIVALQFRRPRDVAAVLLPLAAGSLLLMGTLGLAGIPLNYINIGILPMLLGIGIDYGIFVVQGIRERGAASGAADVAGAVALAAMTTAAGFGSLMITDFVAIYSMGLIALLGVASIAAAALTLLPAVSAFLAGWRDGPNSGAR